MNLIDLKGHLFARRGNLTTELREKRQTVVLLEADLIRARREADTVSGALQATERDLADVEAVLDSEAVVAHEPPVQAAVKPAGTAVAAPVHVHGKG